MYFAKIILFLTLLQVNSEWVEIAQQHYRKQVRPNYRSDFDNIRITPRPDNRIHEQTTKSHDNRTANEPPWTKGNVYRVQNLGSTKKIGQKEEPVAKLNVVKDHVETSPDKEKETLIHSSQNPKSNDDDLKNKLVDTQIPKLTTDYKTDKNQKENKQQIDKENPSNGPKETPSNNNKKDKIDIIVKFLKIVAETISKSTHKNFESKIKYLQQLQDSILMNIEKKIEATWPDDDKDNDSPSRKTRSTHAQTRGSHEHVDFPSSESALMTISFLTFAVFVIKLVLQVIQTYKNKTMMMTPAVFAVSRDTLRNKPT